MNFYVFLMNENINSFLFKIFNNKKKLIKEYTMALNASV